MDPVLQLVERSSGIIDPTLGSMDMSGGSEIIIRSIRSRCQGQCPVLLNLFIKRFGDSHTTIIIFAV